MKLFEQYIKEFLIYEGLIVTHPLSTVKTIMGKKYKIKLHDTENSFILSFTFSYDIEEAIKSLMNILVLANNLGWFPSIMSAYDSEGNYCHKKWDTHREEYYKKDWELKKEQFTNFKELIKNGYISIVFSFEAIKDIKDTYDKYLYHATDQRNISDIKKYGLVPKSMSKKAYHPDRIFLSKNPEDLYRFIVEAHNYSKKNNNEIKTFIILEIDTIKINFYLEIFRDVNFKDKGYFTMNTITPYCLKTYEKINF